MHQESTRGEDGQESDEADRNDRFQVSSSLDLTRSHDFDRGARYAGFELANACHSAIFGFGGRQCPWIRPEDVVCEFVCDAICIKIYCPTMKNLTTIVKCLVLVHLRSLKDDEAHWVASKFLEFSLVLTNYVLFI